MGGDGELARYRKRRGRRAHRETPGGSEVDSGGERALRGQVRRDGENDDDEKKQKMVWIMYMHRELL
jgi:hypothetical protein